VQRTLLGIGLLVLLFLAGVYGVAVAVAYHNPPLSICGGASNTVDGRPVLGVGLCNWGYSDVFIEDISVENTNADIFIIKTVNDGSSWLLPESVAVDPDYSSQAFSSNMELTIGPSRAERNVSFGLRIQTKADSAGTPLLIIRYRYLGWPMTMRTWIDIPVYSGQSE